MFVLATHPCAHTLAHTKHVYVFLMQEEKQTQISKANKKPVTPLDHPCHDPLRPSPFAQALGFGFEFGLG